MRDHQQIMVARSMAPMMASMRAKAVSSSAMTAATAAAVEVLTPAAVEVSGVRTIRASAPRLHPEHIIYVVLIPTLWLIGALTCVGVITVS